LIAPHPPRGRVKCPRPRGQKKLQKLGVAQVELGKVYYYEEQGPGIVLGIRGKKDTVWLQGDDAQEFLAQVDTITEIWANDPNNTEGRCCNSWEEHLDELINLYF